MKKSKGSRFHPARISGQQKFLRAKQANEDLERSKRINTFEPLNTKKGNWSLTPPTKENK